MDKIVNKFVLYVFDHPSEDVLDLMNQFVRTLNPEELKAIEGMFPLVLESGVAAKKCSTLMKNEILKENHRQLEQE